MVMSKQERSKRAKYAIGKGKRYERKIAHMICDTLGFKYELNPRMDRSGAGNRSDRKGDIDKSDELAEIFPFHVECKNQEDWMIESFLNLSGPPKIVCGWIDQAIKDSKGTPWMIVFSRNYVQDFVIVPFSIGMNLLDANCKVDNKLNVERHIPFLSFFYNHSGYDVYEFSIVMSIIERAVKHDKKIWKKTCEWIKNCNYNSKGEEDE